MLRDALVKVGVDRDARSLVEFGFRNHDNCAERTPAHLGNGHRDRIGFEVLRLVVDCDERRHEHWVLADRKLDTVGSGAIVGVGRDLERRDRAHRETPDGEEAEAGARAFHVKLCCALFARDHRGEAYDVPIARCGATRRDVAY